MCSWSPSLIHSLPPSNTHPIHHDFFLGPSFVSPYTNRHKAKRVVPPSPLLSLGFPSFSFLRLPSATTPLTLHVRSLCDVMCVCVLCPFFFAFHPLPPSLFFFLSLLFVSCLSLCLRMVFFLCVVGVFFCPLFFPTITLLYARALGPARSLTHQQQHNNKGKKDAKNTIGAERADFRFPQTQLIRILF